MYLWSRYFVVPANAGTHNPGQLLSEESRLPHCVTISAAAYGSPDAQLRICDRASLVRDDGNYRPGATLLFVCYRGLARSANALATPSIPTRAVSNEAPSTSPSAIRG